VADVTKDLLIKIGTEGASAAASDIDQSGLSLEALAIDITGANAAWDIFIKMLGYAKQAGEAFFSVMQDMTGTASTFEQFGLRLHGIFGGEEGGREALQWADDFGAKYALTNEDVIARMVRLKGLGIDPMTGSMEILGNAVSATGANFDTIAQVISKISETGKVTTRELVSLTRENIPAFGYLRDIMGLTADQIGEIGKAGLDAKKVVAALYQGMSQDFHGAMERASTSWASSLVVLADNWETFSRRLMGAGPFDFLKSSAMDLRRLLGDWLEYDGANLAFRMGGLITSEMERWRDIITDRLIPGFQVMAEIGYNFGRTLVPVWNGFLDISGMIVGPITAGLRAILGLTGELSAPFDAVLQGLRQEIPEALGWILQKFGDLVIGGEEVWVTFKNHAFTTLNDLQLYLGKWITDFTMSPGGDSLLSLLGLTPQAIEGIADLGIKMTKSANEYTAVLYQGLQEERREMTIHRDFWNSFVSGSTADLKAMLQPFSDFKVDAGDPFGLKKLADSWGGSGPDGNAHLLWQQGVNEKTSGKVLYDATPGGKDSKEKKLQLIAPPGDPLLRVFAEYINDCIVAEGTEGPGI